MKKISYIFFDFEDKTVHFMLRKIYRYSKNTSISIFQALQLSGLT